MASGATRAWPGGGQQGRGVGQGGEKAPTGSYPQDGDFGVEGTDLWLAASGDQRVSIWASDWPQGHCELVDWLSFPAPALMEVRVLGGRAGRDSAWPPRHSVPRPSTGSRLPSALPRCLLPLGWGAAGVRRPWRAPGGDLLQPPPQAGTYSPPTMWQPWPGAQGWGGGGPGAMRAPAQGLTLTACRWWRRSHCLSLLCP